jgi:hypothetical protein
MRALGVRIGFAVGVAALSLAVPRVQAELSDEVLAVHREATALLQSQRPAAQIYVSSSVDKLLLRRVQVQIDEQPPVEYEYSSFESEALQRGGLHRLHATALEPGLHRLRALLIARRVDAGPLTPRIELRIDETFELGATPFALELGMIKPGWRDAVAPQVVYGAPQPAQHERAAHYAEVAQLAWQAPAEMIAGGATLPPAQAGAGLSIGRYNDAVTMIRDGRRDAGIAALRALATADAVGPGARRVRDLANLTLGYQLLRERQAEVAAEALRRVRSPGAYGNAALLALGWTSLLPTAGAGETEPGAWWPQDAADSPELRRRMPFRYNWSVAAGERARDLHAALVPWNELTGRDPLDPVVQEGMLVVAYALQHLGAYEQAQRHYLRSIERLQDANAILDAALAEARDGRMLARIDATTDDGWRRWLADLPYDDGTAYFRTLVEDADVIDALEARRPLLFQRRLLVEHAQALADHPQAQELRARIEALSLRVGAALHAADTALIVAAEAALQVRAKTTRAYLAEARFAVARLHDPSPRARERSPQRIAGAALP